jgi:formylglycine-generating enzyme required for sulfatase activity
VNSTMVVVTIPNTIPNDMILIPAGAFTMGRTSGDADSNAPTVNISLNSFYAGKYEVTKGEWDEVRSWAVNNGYTDLGTGAGNANNHPVQMVSWWDVIKWCNARSQKEGLVPCYMNGSSVMKTGTLEPTVLWSENGYRLPTEAEWEKAARGGVGGKRYPWGSDTISHNLANYYSQANYSYDLSGSANSYHPNYMAGSTVYTAPVGSFVANGYGFHDMTGNVWEWCWDWHSTSTYVDGVKDPRGPATGTSRVGRGGGWGRNAADCRVSARATAFQPSYMSTNGGLRLFRSSIIKPRITTQPASATIISGVTTTLTVAASGTGPLSYQWYQGTVGTTTTPVGTNSSSFTTLALTESASYWVRVSNAAGTVDSTAATVTVNAAPPTITTQPASTTITSGSTATLSVVATGTAPLSYQWYQGAVGITTSPVGANSESFTTPALTATTTYWVRVSNVAAGVNSALATVTVAAVTTPTGFSLIPAGAFTMGDALDGASDAPTHTVNVSAFYMAQNLVTKEQWDSVRTWAVSNGYSDLVSGAGKASNHPVQAISWFQMVKWCNARSQQEGLTPVYYTNDAQTTVYNTGEVYPTNAQVKWTANGYRLPTESEWEKAARGGLSGKRFPWGDTISHDQANYYASSAYSYDLSGAVNNYYRYHPTYETGSTPYTSPVGSFAANGYGLYDMAGNVEQWCWDWYGASTYVNGATDPRGANSGRFRVFRGGSWVSYAGYCRVASRGNGNTPNYAYYSIGFRVARSSVP